ncbi:hypothetical protein ACWIB8_05220 [Corynebacterium flavescens]
MNFGVPQTSLQRRPIAEEARVSDLAANSDGNPVWTKFVPAAAALFGWFSGWIMPDLFSSGWSEGHGDVKAGLSAISAIAGALLPGWVSGRFSVDRFMGERLDNAVDGFKDAAMLLANFSSKDASSDEAERFRKDLANVLSRAVSFGGRKARIVVYFLERGEDEFRDADSETEVGASGSTRYFVYDCYGGRDDSPKHREYSNDSDEGKFFCTSMLGRKQIVVKNTKKPPRGAKISSSISDKYGSFILTPVEASDGEVRAAISIDFPGKSRFDSFDCSVAWKIVKLFQDTFESTIKSAGVSTDEVENTIDQITFEEAKSS